MNYDQTITPDQDATIHHDTSDKVVATADDASLFKVSPNAKKDGTWAIKKTVSFENGDGIFRNDSEETSQLQFNGQIAKTAMVEDRYANSSIIFDD